MANILVRVATNRDVQALVNLHSELYEDNFLYDDDLDMDRRKSNDVQERFTDKINDKNYFKQIAEVDGKVIGYLMGKPLKYSFKKTTMGEIEDMVIDSEYRSKGIGSQLVSAFKQWCLKRGIKRIVCDTYAANKAAVKFYEKQGMSITAVILEGDIESSS